jgi:hypothetical protein
MPVATSTEVAAEEKKPEDAKVKPATAAAEMRTRIAYAQAAQAVQERVRALNIGNLSQDDQAALAYTAEDLRDPDKQRKFDAFYNRLKSIPGIQLGEAAAKYRVAAGHIGQEPFNMDRAGIWPEKPFAFGEDAYKPGASRAVQMKELHRIDRETRSGVLSNRLLSQMTDAELKDEHNVLSQIQTYISAAGDIPLDAKQKVELLSELGVARGAPGLAQLSGVGFSVEGINKRLEAVHRVRSLNTDVSDEARGAGDTILTNAPDAEKLRDAKSRLMKHIESAEAAARWLEDETYDESQVKELRGFADEMRNNLDLIKSDDDVDNYIAANRSKFQQMNDVYRRRFQSMTETEGGSGGSILG